jgi:hypothetical protein
MDLGGDGRLVVLAEQKGAELVADKDIVAQLSSVTKPIEKVGGEVLEAVKRAKPTKAIVELGFGLAIEQGQLVALLGKGKAEATIKATFEWSERGTG